MTSKTVFLSAGQKLNKNTIADELFSSRGHSKIKSETVDISAWSEKNHCRGQEEFIEESKYIPKYNQVLSLLYLP